MASERDRIDVLIAQLEEFLAGTDRRRIEIPIEVGSDRRWSSRDTARLFARLGRPVPDAPLDQRLSDVLAEVVRLRNALVALRDTEPEAPEKGS
ncbi:MAG: hypothetical protein ABJB93_09655 [Gaiellales bacterium]